MRYALAIALKDLRLLSRDRVALFWVVGFPVIFAAFFGLVMQGAAKGEPRRLSVAVVDSDASPASRRVARVLGGSSGLSLVRTDMEAARRSVQRGDAIAYVHFEPGFGRALSEGKARIGLGIDPSRRSEAALVERGVIHAATGASSVRPAAQRLKVDTVDVSTAGSATAGGWELVLPAAVLWALMGCAASFAISMVGERARGTMMRLLVAPIPRAAVLGGKALGCFLACVTIATVLALVGSLALNVAVSSPLGLALAIASTSACFVGITMLLSTLGKTEQSVAGAGWATLVLMAMLGGAMVPLSVMPDWLVHVSDASPVKWGIVALEGAIWRDVPLSELLVPCAVLLGLGIAGLAAGLELAERQEA